MTTEHPTAPAPQAQNQVAAAPAVLRATIEIIRAGTGKKEVFELVGTTTATDTKEET